MRATFTARIVRYSGSIVACRGLVIYKYDTPAGAVLRTVAGDRLNDVRPTSFTAVEVPALTERRVWTLRDLQDGRKADPRATNWLIGAQLAERDDAGKVTPTELGWAIAQAYRWR